MRDSQTRDRILDKAQGALVAAAVGDALGWPSEQNSQNISKPSSPKPSESFSSWCRRSGGGYYSHEERILPGEYSDDTQLLLATARSILRGQHWWNHLTLVEIPAWTLYERGGGGATKKAADQWIGGQAPWSAKNWTAIHRYFEAGGNGVAMRILPHCLAGASEDRFSGIASSIMANGVTTHGHPRALVGALVYGFALWRTLRESGRLRYGELIDEVISDPNQWAPIPDIAALAPSWWTAAKKSHAGRYDEVWTATVQEALQLLRRCQDGIGRGALAVDDKTLADLGCFEPKTNGAGTTAAAAALFLASRYAASPMLGVRQAAFMMSADTDTIASMSGGLLGALQGVEWLGPLASQVQDTEYLLKTADTLVSSTARELPSCEGQKMAVSGTELRDFKAILPSLAMGDVVSLPDGREAQLTGNHELPARDASVTVVQWKLAASDGQTIYVKSFSRRSKRPGSRESNGPDLFRQLKKDTSTASAAGPVRVLSKLPVRDVERSRGFYEGLLGCSVETSSRGLLIGKALLLVASRPDSWSAPRCLAVPVVSIGVPSVERVYAMVYRSPVPIVEPLATRAGTPSFRCLDPDGNALEVYQSSAET